MKKDSEGLPGTTKVQERPSALVPGAAPQLVEFTALSLFSCGGLMDIGLEHAGLRIVGAVDWDPWALAAHQLNLPGVPVSQADLVRTPAENVLERLGAERCDLLVSTPPCQCWTMANGKSGIEHDERRFCLPVVAKYSAILKPRVVLLENVLGLQNKGAGPAWLAGLEEEFRAQGYVVLRWVVNAKDYGAPQNRERLIVLAYRDCPEPTRPAPTVERPRTFGEEMDGLSEEAALAEGCLRMSISWQDAYSRVPEGTSPEPGRAYPRQRSDEPSAALRTSPCVRICPIHVHPTATRFYSVVEYQRLQCASEYKFPTGMPLKWKYLLMGEGNPPPVAEALGCSIVEALGAADTATVNTDGSRSVVVPASEANAFTANVGGSVASAVAANAGTDTSTIAATCTASLNGLPPATITTATRTNCSPVKVVAKSQNFKTGLVSATYSSQATCPTSCPFRKRGCYGENDNVWFHTRLLNLSSIRDPIEIARLEAQAIDALPGGRDLRVHVVGDCPNAQSAALVGSAMVRFEARSGHGSWTYTHAWPEVPVQAWQGAHVTASCESPAQVKEAQARGYPTCIIVGEFRASTAYETDGIRVLPCRHAVDGTHCVDCRVCMNPEGLFRKDQTVGFLPHGSGEAEIREVLAGVRATA